MPRLLRSSKITTFFLITWPSRRRRSVRLSLLTSLPKTKRADLECPPPYLFDAGSYIYIPLDGAALLLCAIGEIRLVETDSLKSSLTETYYEADTVCRFLKEGRGSNVVEMLR